MLKTQTISASIVIALWSIVLGNLQAWADVSNSGSDGNSPVKGKSDQVLETWLFTSLHWPPYTNRNSKNQGVISKQLNQQLKKYNIRIKLDFYPWLRAQQLAHKSKVYMGYLPAWEEEVQENFIASEAMKNSNIAVIVNRASNIKWQDLDTLFRHNQVALVRSFRYPDSIELLSSKYPNNVLKVNNDEDLCKVLRKQRVDAIISDTRVIEQISKINGLSKATKVIKHLDNKPLYIAVHSKHQQRLKLLNKIIKEVYQQPSP